MMAKPYEDADSSSSVLSGGVIKGTTSFTAKQAPLYEDDLQIMPPHRRYASGLDRATQLRIGDCVFAVSPELIRMRSESRGQKTYPIRQPTPVLTQSGYSEREIRVTLYFTTIDEINGFPVPGPDGAVYYMDGLRPFLSMIRHSPILPVRNEYLNLVCDVWSVIVAGVLIQTVDGFPGVLAVELVMRPAAMEVYLMRHSSEYDELINWPLFRWHYQRAVADHMEWAPSQRPLPKVKGKHLDEKLAIQIVDVENLGTSPWDNVPYHDYPLTDGVWLKSVSIQFQNILAPLQTQLAEEPTYQFMGAVDTTVMLQIECEDRTAAAQLVQLQKSVLAQARAHHNRVVTSPLKIENELLNILGISHVIIESADMTTVPGMPGTSQVTMALSAFNPAQSQSEKLESYTPAEPYRDVMNALQTIDPSELNFVEQATLAELYFQSEQLYPDLDLPLYRDVKSAVIKINGQRAGLGLDAVPVVELSSIEWSDFSVVDADFWMTYPGLAPGGVFDLDALQIPQDIQSIMRGDDFASTLNSARNEILPAQKGLEGVSVIGDVDLHDIPPLTGQQLGEYMTKRMIDIPDYNTLFKVQPTTLDFWLETDEMPRTYPPGSEPTEVNYLPYVVNSFIKAQTETGISAAFWIALAGHESDWGQCDTKDGKTSYTWRAKNVFNLTAATASTPHIKAASGHLWRAYNNINESIEMGARSIYQQWYLEERRTTLGKMVVTYVGDNDGDDKSDWVRSISEIIKQITGGQWADAKTPEATHKRGKQALKDAGDVLYRDYQSFDIMDDQGQLKPRMLTDTAGVTDYQRMLAATLHNMVRFGHRGRLTRAFPTFLMVFIDEGGMDRYARKVWANFYMYHSLINIDLIRERHNPADTLHLTMTNVYGTLNWKTRHNIPIIDGFANFFQRAWDGLFFNWERNEYLLEYRKNLLTHFDLRPGMRVHLRLGYSANPALNPVVFNGNLTDVEFGETIEAVAQGDGRELLNDVFDVSKSSANSLDYTVSGTLVEAMTADSSSWFGRLITKTTGGDIVGSRTAAATSKYGLEHFGPMKMDTIFTLKKIQPLYERYKNIYPADFDSRLKRPDEGTMKKAWDKMIAFIDKAQGAIGFDQANDNEKLIWVDVRGKTVWDVIKICETASPGYIGYPIYHGFDTRLFFGMPMWTCVYNWRMKRARGPKEHFTKDEKLSKDLFVEMIRPFTQFHVATSMADILSNGIRTTNQFPTAAIGVYGMGGSGNTETPPQYADFTMRPDMQRVETVDLNLYQDLWLWDTLWDALGLTDTRSVAISATRNHLAKRMAEMYTGQIVLIGDPSINPHDVLHITDTYWSMAGNVTVDKIIHHMSADGGFISVVEPKLIAFSKDQLGQNNEFAKMISDFSTDIGSTVRGTIGLAAGLIALGQMRALIDGGSKLMAIARTAGDIAIPATRLSAFALFRLGRFTWTVGKNLIGVALGRGQILTRLGNIKQYGEMISKSWTVLSEWASAAATEYSAGGFSAGVGGVSDAMAETALATGSAEIQAAARLVGGLEMAIPFVVVTAITSLGIYWIQGILEEYVLNKDAVTILPLAYYDSFLVAGIEGWSKLIPGHPDPKYVHVRSVAEAADTLVGLIKLPDNAHFQNPIQTGFLGVTDRFGIPRNNALGMHTGVDLAANEGTPIFPVAEGTVTKVAYDSIYGNYVEIQHAFENGTILTSKYAHMVSTHTTVDDKVSYGTTIGFVGQTGDATGPHVHLEFRIRGEFKDPADWIF